jgi:hypothetical protein
MRIPVRPLARLLTSISLVASAGCQNGATRTESGRPVDRSPSHSITLQSHTTVVAALPSPAPQDDAPPHRADLRSIASWPESLLSIELAGPLEQTPWQASRVRVRVPCVARIDSSAAFSWLEALRAHFDEADAPNRRGRLLARPDSGTPSAFRDPDECFSPTIALEAIEVPIDDEPSHFGLVLVDGDHPGAWATRVRLDRATDLLPLLQAIDRPRSVRLLAIDAAGRVIHGVSLPLLPMAKSRPEAPQALLSPWWIRDRRTAPHDPVVWRNAAQWLAHGRTLAQAACELPETVGDILFLPMLGWQSSIVASPWAVGGVEFDLTIELPSDVASRIDRFEFHLSDAL